MATIWADISGSFVTLMETTISGSAHNTFKLEPDAVDLKNIPSSVFNGAYSIQMNGVPTIAGDVNTYLEYTYSVRLQVAYEINANDNKVSYRNAIEDLEIITRKRMKATSWAGTTIMNITLDSINKPDFLANAGEVFMIVNMDFSVTGITSIN